MPQMENYLGNLTVEYTVWKQTYHIHTHTHTHTLVKQLQKVCHMHFSKILKLEFLANFLNFTLSWFDLGSDMNQ